MKKMFLICLVQITVIGYADIVEFTEYGSLDGVKECIANGKGVSLRNTNGQTLLMIASKKGYLDIVKYLVDNGANVNIKNNINSALTYSLDSNKLDISKYLIDNGASISQNELNKALKLALINNDKETEKYLLSKGANTSEMDITDWTIIGNLDKIKEEIDGRRIDGEPLYTAYNIFNTMKEAMPIASQYGHLDIIKYFADKNSQTYTAEVLLKASQYGHLDIVKYLVDNGANINKADNWGITALSYASENGYLDIVKYLVDNGANINIMSRSYNSRYEYEKEPIILAMKNKHFEIVRFLINNGADISYMSMDMLAYAGKLDKVKVEEYLKKYIAPNILVYASLGGHLDLVKYLIENKKANINRGSDEAIDFAFASVQEFKISSSSEYSKGKTPLMSSSASGYLDIVEYLISKKAKINKADASGDTALMYASRNGYLDIVKVLVENKAKINKVSKGDVSALEVASAYGHLDVVQYLIDNGAKITTNTLKYAKNRNNREVINYLKTKLNF